MTDLVLYDTLTREKAVFRPIDPKNVRMYVCGPTVYDFAHIGNARPVIVFDLLFRVLRNAFGADRVTYVRNITDVDDKINARALAQFGDAIAAGSMSLNQAISEVTGPTTARFHEDARALGCLDPTHEPRATGHIDGMIAMIQTLIDKGHAYAARGREGWEVLFDVSSMPDYGALSRRNLEEQQAGARVAVEAHKKNPADFVLWKESDEREPGWDAAFTAQGSRTTIRGRPGWHIECSVMSKAHLGKKFDIHGGGLDLIFPHHENEIAQSRCAHGNDGMANIWMHNGFLQVEGRKMAKSEGNFVTIRDLLETGNFGGRSWPGEVLRLAMLMTHYREPIDFSIKRLSEAEERLRGWRRAAMPGESHPVDQSMLAELHDDLNFHRAAVVLDTIARKANRGENEAAHCLGATLEFLGLSSTSQPEMTQAAARQTEEVVAQRLALLQARNFTEADRIRDELAQQGIQLMDYKDPDTGERKTKWELRR